MNQSPDEPVIEDAVLEDDAAVAVPGPVPSEALGTDYTDDGTPTFDYVQGRIEGRVATSLGATELAGATPEAASVDEQFAAREQAGRDRLEEIRRAMRKE